MFAGESRPAETSKDPRSLSRNEQECVIHQQEGIDNFYHQAFGDCTAKAEKFWFIRLMRRLGYAG